jgi:hypothetical protein
MVGGIFQRVDHYEVHLKDKVEFWNLTLTKKLGESQCHKS